MAQMFVFTIGWQDYAIDDPEEALRLLDVAQRVVPVKYASSDSYTMAEEPQPLVTSMRVSNVYPASTAPQEKAA